MAAGWPVISWDVPRARTKALFTPGWEILLFDKNKPEELAAQIDRLQKDPVFARQLAENARQKILRYHTAEIRVRQIFDWIQDGKRPDYGENTTPESGTHLALNCSKTSVPMSQPLIRQYEALTAASTLLSQGDRAGAVEILKTAAEEFPQHPETLCALGTQLFLLQRHDEATVAFARLAQLLPNDAKTQIQLAAAAVKASEIETFETALTRAFELEPENVAALKLLAGLCLQQGQYKEAGQSYLKLAQIDENDPDVLHGLGVCFFKSGDFETAQAVYERILSLVPGDTLAKENLDVVRGKLTGTNVPPTTASPAPIQPAPTPRETLAQALERAEFFLQSGNKIAARTELEHAAELAPHNDLVIDSLGGLQYSAGDFEAARKSFRRLIELRPRDTQAYTLLAMATIKCNRLDEFESAIGLALEIDPQNQTALEFLAKTNLEHGRFADAGRFFTKLLELRGDDADTLLALGLCFVRGNDYDSARMVYERVLEMQPHNAIAHENLGALKKLASAATPATPTAPQKNDASQIVALAKTSIQTGDILRAVSLLKSALAAQPDNADAVEILGKIRFGSNDFARARELFLKLTKLTPRVPGAWVNLALSSYKLDDVAAFEEALGHALELDPNNWQTLTVLAQLSFNHQNWPDAAQTYARVVQQRPDDIEAIIPLGVCFFKAGQAESAAEMFRRVLELDPSNTLAKENLQAVEKAPQPPTATPPIAVEPQAPAPAGIRIETGDTGTARPSAKILPPCAKLGILAQAEAHLEAGDHLGAWNAGLAAIALRPFHPEAYLHMAETALDAKDEQQALRCVKRLLQLTPKWDVPNNVHRSLKQQRKLTASKIAWTPMPELPARPRLSVCLIVKNEERFLAQCLRSVKGVAHQIVVVDTGSTDRTVEIAKEHGAEVYHFAWNDNFSDARNFALEHARGDWVLSLDADEELMATSVEQLWRDLAAPNAIGYRIPLKNHIDTADGVTYVPRLFRNAPGLYFIGRVHEQIYTTVIVRQNHWQMEAPMGTTTLMHYGYDPEVKKEKNKVKRNLDLLERAVIEMPDEPALLMNFGLDLVNDGHLERGLEQYRKAVALIEKHESKNVLPEVRERLMTMFVFHLLTAEHYDEALRVATSRLAQDCGPTASMHYVAALAHVKLGQHPEAIPQLRACIAKAKDPVLTPGCQGVAGAPPYHLLADCLAREGKAAEAEKEFKLALEFDPKSLGIRHDYAKFFISQKRCEEALPLLHQGTVEGRMDAVLWKLGCEIVNGHLNLPDLALEWTEAALADHPNNEELRKHRGIALLTAGKAAEALPFFEAAPNPTHPVVAGAIILCRLLAGSPATTAQPSNESAVSQEFISWYRRLLTHNSAKAVHEINRLLPVLQPLLPTATKVLREAATGAD